MTGWGRMMRSSTHLAHVLGDNAVSEPGEHGRLPKEFRGRGESRER